MYPYVLGIHFKSQMLCRLMHPAINNTIPQGFGRVIRHADGVRFRDTGTWHQFSKVKRLPYIDWPMNKDWNEVELDPKYYSLYRWIDLQRRFNEPVTGLGDNDTPVIVTFLDANEQLDR